MQSYVTLKVAKQLTGLCGNTLRKYADEGKIPHYRLPNGDRRFDVSDFCNSKSSIVCYARVSSPKQRDHLRNQAEYLAERYPQAEIVQEVGSGLNFKRKGLRSILERAVRGERITLVVSYRDRLARFGFELVEFILGLSKGEVVVLNQIDTSPQAELVADLMAVITVFSARLHGLRQYKSALKTASSEDNPSSPDQEPSADTQEVV